MDHDALGEAAGSGPRKRAATKCFTCGGEGHMARDCTSTRCHYCGRQGHIAKTCPMGQAGCKHPDQLFVFCDKLDDVSQPPGRTSSLAPLAPPLQDCGSDAQGTTNSATAADSNCFVRRFVVPLSRARPDFTLSDLVDGRLDVACRCVSSALMRSQGVRANTQILLSFPPCAPQGEEAGAATGDGSGRRSVCIAVTGGLVREVHPDEADIAKRLRLALDSQLPHWTPNPTERGAAGEGGATQESARGEESKQKRKQREALTAKLNRGFECREAEGGARKVVRDLLDYALERAGDGSGAAAAAPVQASSVQASAQENSRLCSAAARAPPLVILHLDPQGERLEEFLHRLRGLWWPDTAADTAEAGASAPAPAPAARESNTVAGVKEVVVLVGDDRGLSHDDVAAFRQCASEVGALFASVSLGASMLLASHCIVITHYLLDSILHQCPSRMWAAPPKAVIKRRKQTQARRKGKG
eukprot:Tamp_07962.p1 GENE.Tamp_07962~~Tamp_07962.p1  ORF type:complete len:472 (-),score=79.53 Tamp_07962:347-1762(-)